MFENKIFLLCDVQGSFSKFNYQNYLQFIQQFINRIVDKCKRNNIVLCIELFK